LNKDINYIFNSIRLKPLIEPIIDVNETSILEYSTFNEDIAQSFNLSTDDDYEDEKLLSKSQFNPKTKTTPSNQNLTLKASNSRQNSSNIETFKGQQHFLNKIKKSEPSTSQTSTLTNRAELSAIIREKKKTLDAEINNRMNQPPQSSGIKKTVQIDYDISKVQEDKLKLKRKRIYEDTTESTPLKVKSRSPSPVSKRHQRSPASSFATQNFESLNRSPANFVRQKGYIEHGFKNYFRVFNVKKGFTLESLDQALSKFISPKFEFSVDLFLISLIKVIYLFQINFNLIPL
jgi:hypothetical protein